MRALIILLMLALPGLARAAQPLAVSSKVFVERTVTGSDGRLQTVLSSPETVMPGDQLVFIMNYRNPNSVSAAGMQVKNAIPSAIAYQYALGGAEVSVDGGKSWGSLPRLFIAEHNGRRRSARPDEVTHIRWQFAQAIPAGASGRLTFRGTVR